MSDVRNLAVTAGILGVLGLAVSGRASFAEDPVGSRPSSPDEAHTAVPVDPALMTEGRSVYRQTCSQCHQANGRGLPDAFPPLAGNAGLGKLPALIATIRGGHSGPITVKGQSYDQAMPAIGADLSDEKVAAVATYVRNSWGNHFGGVTRREVEEAASSGTPPGR